MDTFRVGFIGCGRHSGSRLYPGLRDAGLELVAVCDLDEEKAQTRAAQYNVKHVYTDHEAMCREHQLDAVLVVTGPRGHYALTKSLLDLGHHVWTEKPCAETTAQADELADYLMGRLRDTLDSMRKEERLLPEEYQWHGNGLQQWLKGLLTAHQQLEKQWQQAWQMSEQTLDLPALSGRLNRCLKLFTTLADPQSRLQQTSPEKRQELTDGLPRLAASLPPMLREYVAISGELVQVLPNQFEVVPKTTGE